MTNSRHHRMIDGFLLCLLHSYCVFADTYYGGINTDYGTYDNKEETRVLKEQTAILADEENVKEKVSTFLVNSTRGRSAQGDGDSASSENPTGNDVSRNITTILNTLLENYDKRLRPNYGGAPVVVFVTIYVSTISAVSEVEMDYTLDMYLRQYWTDPRLAFTGINESLTIGIDMVKNIWLTVTANCPMNLEYFPMDGQNCSLEIESYGYSTRDIIYTWMEGKASVAIAPDINLAQFSISGHSNHEREISLSTGNYSRLSAHFTFRRNLGFYLIQIYLPSSLIVIISWVSFWLNREATQARVAIGVTTVLTMTTLMTSTNASMPKVSYVKSIDIYLGTCFVIVFASLLEYAAVGYLLKRVKMKRELAEQRAGAVKALPAMMFGNAAAAAAVGGPPLPFTPSTKQPLLQANNVQSSSPRQCVHGNCNYCDQQAPYMQNRRDSYSTVTFSWTRRPGYQSIGPASPHELQQFRSRPYLERYPSQAETALACDCDADTTSIFMGDDPPPGMSRREMRYARRRGRQRHAGMQRGFRPSSIDKYSRIFFPLSFVVFHVIYWTVYLYTTG